MLISFKVLSTHLLNADALIIVLDFFQISLKNCRVLIILSLFNFQGSFSTLSGTPSAPFLKGARLYYHNQTRLSTLFFKIFKLFLHRFSEHNMLGIFI